jgi:hypothetical protein
VNAVMNLRFHNMRGNSFLPEDLLLSQELFCSMELVVQNFISLIMT